MEEVDMIQSEKLLYTAKVHTTGERVLKAADQTCPYSKATRGNIDVAIKLT
jgi:organic hydroperoxide reductase OsmC/OhrA